MCIRDRLKGPLQRLEVQRPRELYAWFSRIAFGGINYENTPVAEVTHSNEPGSLGKSSDYFATCCNQITRRSGMTCAKLSSTVLILLGTACLSFSQGTFENFGFESASLVPIPGDPYQRVQFNAALPGWTGYAGTNPQNAVLYN